MSTVDGHRRAAAARDLHPRAVDRRARARGGGPRRARRAPGRRARGCDPCGLLPRRARRGRSPAPAVSRARRGRRTRGLSGARRSPCEHARAGRTRRSAILARVLISLAADELTGVAGSIAGALERRGHRVLLHGALAEDERTGWAWASEAVARDVADGRAAQGIVCCWTGTGASIAANKLDGRARCAVPRRGERRRRAALERRERARAEPARDLRGAARRDPRRVVRRGAERVPPRTGRTSRTPQRDRAAAPAAAPSRRSGARRARATSRRQRSRRPAARP